MKESHQTEEGDNSSIGTSAYSKDELKTLFPDYITDEEETLSEESEESTSVQKEGLAEENIFEYSEIEEVPEETIDSAEEVIFEYSEPLLEPRGENIDNFNSIADEAENADVLIDNSDDEPIPDDLVVNPEPENVDDLSDIEVIGVDQKLPSFKINLKRSTTTIGKKEIQRRQASDVMELVSDIAGVNIEGGIRASGKKFNIRGFSNNEDILKVVDGARQNFERYRYGNGLDIDPSLLQQVEVIRGSSVRNGGAGTIGGAVIMSTKNARDILKPKEKAGLIINTGYNDNNNQKKGGFTAFAQPLGFVDVLLNVIKKRSNNVSLPDHSEEANSFTKQLSTLTKLSFFTLDYNIDLGYRYSDESVLEPFDALNGLGVGGLVRRQKTTKSPTININWNPEPLWLNLDTTIAYNDQLVVDQGGSIVGTDTDVVGYKILNLELKNRSEFYIGPVQGQIDLGVQSNRERREYVTLSATGVSSFNESQPPGEKESRGIFIDTEFNFKDWTVNSGVRYDDYTISTGGATAEALTAQNASLSTNFNIINFGTGLSFQPNSGPLTLFYNYGQSFRAPLLDELFTLGSGGFSRCDKFSKFIPIPPVPQAADFIVPAPIFFDNAGFTAAIAARAAAIASPFSAENASCAGLYQPETSATHEVGFSLDWSDLLDVNGRLTSKLTFYQTRTVNLIESIYENTLTGEISQPGVEKRQGWELEINYDSDTWFSNLALSILDGTISYNYFDNNIDPRVQALSSIDREPVDLFDIPGDSLSFSLGRRFPSKSLELGYRIKVHGPRLISTDSQNPDIPACATSNLFSPIPSCNVKDQIPGRILHHLFASWEPVDGTRLGLTVNNLTNKEYITPGFGGSFGQIAPGRDVRVSLEHRF